MYMGKKVLLAVAMAAIVSGSAFADDQGSGKIKFKGVVIDAPCSIAPDSVDKEVDLGEVTTAVINANKKSTAVPVDINLENCQLDDPADETDTPVTKVDVTFTSAATDATDTSLMSNTYIAVLRTSVFVCWTTTKPTSPWVRLKRSICWRVPPLRLCTSKH